MWQGGAASELNTLHNSLAGQVDTTTPAMTSYTVGQWVNVIYESQSYCGLILDEQNHHYRIRCLLKMEQSKGYRFEAERGCHLV